MNIVYIKYHSTPFGELIIGVSGDALCLCDWRYRKMRNTIDNRLKKWLDAEYREADHPLISETISQLSEYFSGRRQSFQIPLTFAGSAFQQEVWQQLLKIPYGKTVTYMELARKLGNEKSVRAVAAANGANAISIVVPCHRVTGSNGELTGYAGGLAAKRKLLELEGVENKKTQLKMTF
ncbi:MAG: methylated-DNA--[protein]-cysteine S-methyltransferase [Bacteroidales bacterium]